MYDLIFREEILKVVMRFCDINLFEQDLAKCLDKATSNYCKLFILFLSLWSEFQHQ